jgi:hypothetical protein
MEREGRRLISHGRTLVNPKVGRRLPVVSKLKCPVLASEMSGFFTNSNI